MCSGMYNPPFGASPVRTVWVGGPDQHSKGSEDASQLTSSKESRSEPPLVEKYFMTFCSKPGDPKRVGEMNEGVQRTSGSSQDPTVSKQLLTLVDPS